MLYHGIIDLEVASGRTQTLLTPFQSFKRRTVPVTPTIVITS